MDQQGIDISSYLKALGRRVWTILIVFVVGSILAAAVAYVLPPVYESTAKILVESQQIPEDLAQTTVRQSVAERLELIQQRLMTRDNLLGIINRIGLFADRNDLTPSDKIDRVRESTTFENISFEDDKRRSYRGPPPVSAFTITYSASNSQLAARIANEFVTMVLEQNITSRSQRATETYDFFKQEVQRLSGQLLDLETQITRFKDENDNALPDNYQYRLGELSSLQQRNFENERRRVELEEQKRVLLESLRAGIVPLTAQSPEERQLADLRRTLVQKSSILAENHPEIVALKASISALEQSMAAESKDDPQGDQAGLQAPSVASVSARMDAQIGVIGRELKLLAEQQSANEKRAQELHASLEKTPNVEMQLSAYKRRYENLQAQYDNAVQKLAEAETGRRLEVNRQAERFEVIEQARVPEEPVAPNRIVIAGVGAGGSLMLGLALALLLDMSNPAIRTSADLQRRLQLRPVVTVPYIHTRGERRRRALKWMIRLVLLIGGIAAVLWAVDQYVMPLQVLWDRLVQKTGFEDMVRAVQTRLG